MILNFGIHTYERHKYMYVTNCLFKICISIDYNRGRTIKKDTALNK